MRRWPWLVGALLLVVAAVLFYPRVAETYTAQSESNEPVGSAAGPGIPWLTIVLGVAAGVCLAAGFRPQSAAVRRGLGEAEDGDIHQRTAGILDSLRRR